MQTQPQLDLFDELFILEMANNHWGDVCRGIEIIDQFSEVVAKHKVKAAIKLQLRDVPRFVHRNFRNSGADKDLTHLSKQERYIQKTLRTRLSHQDIVKLVARIRSKGCIPMSTAFDERSVDTAVELALPMIKIASADVNDPWLLDRIASTSKPVIFSSGGCRSEDLDETAAFFEEARVPFAINHCVSKYPTEDEELELNQIDYLHRRYPGVPIGLSTHEYHDWVSSMMVSYSKGARLWERHIDISYPKGHQQKEVSQYCSLPDQIDTWFKSFHKVKAMCGCEASLRREISEGESNYLNALHRGLYLSRNMNCGELVTPEDLYPAIPWQKEKGQLTSRDIEGCQIRLTYDVTKDAPLLREHCDPFGLRRAS